jgi:RNA polymerase sigma-70 factor (ECF subfamily)
MRRPSEDNELRHQIGGLLPRLSRFARVLAGSRADADRLLQTVCERALHHVRQWDAGTRLDGWLFRIAQTVWRDRRPAEDGRAWPAEAPLPSTADVAPHADIDVLVQRVQQAVDSLPEEQRVVLLLVCVEGMSYRDAAEAASIPLGTLVSRLAQARLTLAGQIGPGAVARHDNVLRLNLR